MGMLKVLVVPILFLFSVATPVQFGDAREKATDAQALQMYHVFNVAYFEGKLPADVRVHFVEHLTDGTTEAMGITSFTQNSIEIALAAEYRDNYSIWGETLLHEACHIKVRDEIGRPVILLSDGTINTINLDLDQHGPKWQACMLELAENNAFKSMW
jgi:hypothetical protein